MPPKRKRPALKIKLICDCDLAHCDGQILSQRQIHRHHEEAAAAAAVGASNMLSGGGDDMGMDDIMGGGFENWGGANANLTDDIYEVDLTQHRALAKKRRLSEGKRAAGSTESEHRAYNLMSVNHTGTLSQHVRGRDPLLHDGFLKPGDDGQSDDIDFDTAHELIAQTVCEVASTGATTQGAVDSILGAVSRGLGATGLLPDTFVSSVDAARKLVGLNQGGDSFAACTNVGICLGGGKTPHGCFTFHGEFRDLEFCPKCHTHRYAHLAEELTPEVGAAWQNMSVPEQRVTRARNRRIMNTKGDAHVMQHWPLADFVGDLWGHEVLAEAMDYPNTRRTQPGLIWDVQDSTNWQDFTLRHGGVPPVSHVIGLSWSGDAFKRTDYESPTPILMRVYNLPPWLRSLIGLIHLSLLLPPGVSNSVRNSRSRARARARLLANARLTSN
jgi:hypothetical protein